jgi:hypothetical protein
MISILIILDRTHNESNSSTLHVAEDTCDHVHVIKGGRESII